MQKTWALNKLMIIDFIWSMSFEIQKGRFEFNFRVFPTILNKNI